MHPRGGSQSHALRVLCADAHLPELSGAVSGSSPFWGPQVAVSTSQALGRPAGKLRSGPWSGQPPASVDSGRPVTEALTEPHWGPGLHGPRWAQGRATRLAEAGVRAARMPEPTGPSCCLCASPSPRVSRLCLLTPGHEGEIHGAASGRPGVSHCWGPAHTRGGSGIHPSLLLSLVGRSPPQTCTSPRVAWALWWQSGHLDLPTCKPDVYCLAFCRQVADRSAGGRS